MTTYNGRPVRPRTFTGDVYLENDAGDWLNIPDFSMTFDICVDLDMVVEAAERLGTDGYRVCCLTVRRPRGCAQHTPETNQPATRDLGGGEQGA